MKTILVFTVCFSLGILLTGYFNVSAQTCGTLAPRLIIGEQARITPGPPNILRALPGVSGDYIGEVPGGEWVLVLDGPRCGSGYYWWLVKYGEMEGWTVEGADGTYWIELSEHIPTATLTPSMTPSMTFTPSNTPTITPTPTVTSTFVPLLQTAVAQNQRLYVTRNTYWNPVSTSFNDVEMVLVPAGCYNRSITGHQIAEISLTCANNPKSRNYVMPGTWS